ncbi:Ras- protein Rab-18 [Tilletia horrida]|uniref:Ras- protein Rab-18 n=1 Tax=Tilletia horrida TaxID=155126 RepID=A0AAN6GDT0_9BASI|nr:Ras- protein Rab-18 [Tilletia horrida]KAK0531468.1 Ras- protein Rab-18 [Tilletia horrida]KAK0537398.1 Ras- protein Rab-18 [Tilletia horrida]KAK0562871.1 Ras- protein Rab-18 [Tilletia horrida]
MAAAPITPGEVPTLKILLIGSTATGKSSLLLRFCDDEFLSPEETTATIGVDYKIKSYVSGAGKRFKLSIWDTAGQERFRTLTSSYYRGAQGVIIVYDVTMRDTFDALTNWFNELDTFSTSSDVVKMVVGNKTDKEFQRVVTTEEGQAFADKMGALFIETSAKRGVGVSNAFDELVNRIISTPSLWQKVGPGQRAPGDRMPGGAPGGANGEGGTISLTSAYEAARGCSC